MLKNKNTLNTYKVERQAAPGVDTSWYETMLSPFSTFEQALDYIKKYKIYYPKEYQNYKITYQS